MNISRFIQLMIVGLPAFGLLSSTIISFFWTGAPVWAILLSASLLAILFAYLYSRKN